jgi:predicted RNA methylase
MARYIYHNAGDIEGKTVLDLGSGTGIGGLAALKFTKARKVLMSDYTEEIIELLRDNAKI